MMMGFLSLIKDAKHAIETDIMVWKGYDLPTLNRIGENGKLQKSTGRRFTPVADTIFEGADKLPKYPKANSMITYYKIWKNEPDVRGSARAKVNAAVATGYRARTRKNQDVEKDDARIKNVEGDIWNPQHEFASTLRQAAYNLIIYDNLVLECKKRTGDYFMFALDWQYCTIKPHKDLKDEQVLEYKLDGQVEPTILKRGEWVHVTMESLGSSLHGISVLEAVRDTSNLSDAARQYNLKQFRTGGVPTFAVIQKTGTFKDYIRLRGKMKNFRVGQNVALKGDIEIKMLGQLTKDMEYEKLRNQTRQDIMTAMQTPPVMMAQAGGSQGETERQAMNAFASEINAIQAILELAFAQAIHNSYGDQYKDVYIEFKKWIDTRQQAAVDKLYLNNGVLTPNEVRRLRFDLPDVDWGDLPYSVNATPTAFLDMTFGEELGIAAQQKNPLFDEDGKPLQEVIQNKPAGEEGNDGNEKPEGQDKEKEKEKRLLMSIQTWFNDQQAFNKTLVAEIQNLRDKVTEIEDNKDEI